MTFRYSQVSNDALPNERMMIEDLRNAPVNKRSTQFRLMQQNMLAYTFDEIVPGWASAGINRMPFKQVVDQAVENARREGQHRFRGDFAVTPSAIAKVTGDIYEVLTSAVLWNAAAYWNRFMCGDAWVKSPRYARPVVAPSPKRQVAVLNLPRRFDWVRLLEPRATASIAKMREDLGLTDLSMPTSTPDLAVIVLPEEVRDDSLWRTPLRCLGLESQAMLSNVHKRVHGQVEAGEIILAMALKASLRSDRLYQPLYEANVMQLILEGRLGAPKVEFEVHALTAEGTGAVEIYRAATLHSAGTKEAHRAVRELYVPTSADDVATRFYNFLNGRMSRVAG